MIDYYDDIYKNRLNRYGNDFQSRIVGQRRKVFENYLLKSVYRIDFEYGDKIYPGILEPYSQDETKTMQYLLTDLDLNLEIGSIIEVQKEELLFGNENKEYWLVYWIENKQAAGYHRYTVLKMTHTIKWKDREGNDQETLAYFYGQQDNMLKDELKSRSRSHVLYTENLKLSFFITCFNKNIRKDDYFEITIGEEDNRLTESYVVTGYDIISTPGIEYVSVDPVYIRDNTPAPQKESTDSEEDYYWL